MSDVVSPSPQQKPSILSSLDRVWLIVLTIPVLVVALDPGRAADVLGTAAEAFAGTMPYMAIAILLIALFLGLYPMMFINQLKIIKALKE